MLKKLIRRFLVVICVLFIQTRAYAVYTFSWVGTISNQWTNPANWFITGGLLYDYPGGSGRTDDIVQFGVGLSFFTNQPVLTLTSGTNLAIGSITFGPNEFSIPTITGTTLTVNGTAPILGTLVVSGDIMQMINSNISGTESNYIKGTATISCNNIQVGSTGSNGTFAILFSDVANLIVAGNVNIYLNVAQPNGGGFTLENGSMYLNKSIIFYNPNSITSSNAAYFAVNGTNGSTKTNPSLYLASSNAIAAIPTPYASVNFNGNRPGGKVSVYYTGSSPTVYTTSFAGFGSGGGTISTATPTYDNLYIQGTGTAVVGTGTGILLLDSTLNTSAQTVTFNSFSTITTVGTNWTNSSTIAGGPGNSTINGNVLNSGAMNMASGNLTIGGNYTNNGTFAQASAASDPTLTTPTPTNTTYFTSASPTLNNTNSVNTTAFNNVVFTGGSTATPTMSGSGGFSVSSRGILQIKTAGTALATGGLLTLRSDANGSAAVAPLPGTTTTITGNVNVQRYMSGGTGSRGYRLMSGPVNQGPDGTLLSGVNAYGFKDLQATTIITGYGAKGTYSSSTQPTNGFDPSAQGNPSIFYYNEPSTNPVNTAIVNSDYKGISTINEELPVGTGFLFFFRGNRNVTDGSGNNKATTAAVPENTTLNFYGKLNQNNITASNPTNPIQTVSGHSVYVTPATVATTFTYTNYSSYNDGYQLVGNPYPCAIDLDAITLTSPYNNFIYMLNNTGTFGFYTKGSGGTLLSNGVGRYVLSGQGFFIKANTPTGTTSLSFKETCKVTTIPAVANPTTFALKRAPVLAMASTPGDKKSSLALPVPNQTQQIVRILLALDSMNANETVLRFSQPTASNKFNGHEDAYYMSGPTQTTFMASYTSDAQPCLFNEMGSLDSIKSIQLYAEGQIDGLYTMTFSGASAIDPRYKLYLKDNLLKDSLDLSANTTYKFNVDRTNLQTYGANRFTLKVYPTNIANYYHLSDFTGIKQTAGDLISWKTQYEGNYTGFVLQRSTDGFKTFTVLDSLQSDGSGNYSFMDTKPFMGINQYRLAQNNINNVTSLSNIVTISYQPVNVINHKFNVYPNPSVNNINLNLNLADGANTLFIKVYNTTGVLLMNNKLSAGSTLSQDVSKLNKGNYIIKVTDNNSKDYGAAMFTKL